MRFDEAMVLLFYIEATLFGAFPAAAHLRIMVTSQTIIISG